MSRPSWLIGACRTGSGCAARNRSAAAGPWLPAFRLEACHRFVVISDELRWREMPRRPRETHRDHTGRPSRTVRRHGPAPCLSPPSSSSPGPAPASAPAAAQQSCPAAIATGTSDEDTSREFRTQSVCNARSPRGGAYHVLDQGLLPEELLLGNPELAQRLLSGGVFHLSRAVISGKTTVHV